MILCFLDLGLVRMVSSVFQREREDVSSYQVFKVVKGSTRLDHDPGLPWNHCVAQ